MICCLWSEMFLISALWKDFDSRLEAYSALILVKTKIKQLELF